jgi:uncharacterized NAD(P)/FAD-binding protein YdhS
MVHDYGVALMLWDDDACREHAALLKSTRDLIKDAEENGLNVLGMVDYSSATLPEIAFKLDVLTSRVAALETALKEQKFATERLVECLREAQKPPSNWPLMPHIKRLLTSITRSTSKP